MLRIGVIAFLINDSSVSSEPNNSYSFEYSTYYRCAHFVLYHYTTLHVHTIVRFNNSAATSQALPPFFRDGEGRELTTQGLDYCYSLCDAYFKSANGGDGDDVNPTNGVDEHSMLAPDYDPDSDVSWGDVKIEWRGDQCIYFTLHYTGGCSLAQPNPVERYPSFSNLPECRRQWDGRTRIIEILSGFPGVYSPKGVWTYQIAPASAFAAKHVTFHVPSITLANIWSDGPVNIQILRNIETTIAPGCSIDDDWIRCPTECNVTLGTHVSACVKGDNERGGVVCCGCAKIPDGRHYPSVQSWDPWLEPNVKLTGPCAERDSWRTCSPIYDDVCVQTWDGGS